MFDIPVVLFIFKREKAVDILKEISKVKPKKLYLIADGPRNDDEMQKVQHCRSIVEGAIDWECEVIKNYSDNNRGVYQNIGEGAKWVLSREKWAVFLEDDNLPEETFFRYCHDMLLKYEDNDKILWVCGTNYLEKYDTGLGYSYLFTKHMLPCGWASWSGKFLKHYDGYLETLDVSKCDELKSQYVPSALFDTMKHSWIGEYNRIKNGRKATSWDYQMDYSIKAYDLYGICPMKNQIRNIGVDNDSVHGGNTKKKVMTDRFCDRKTYKLEFPLMGPSEVKIDATFEKKLGLIILPPLRKRIQYSTLRFIRKALKIPENITTKEFIRHAFGVKKRN